MNNFGERLKSLRKAAGITQQELADKLGVHMQTVSKWERGISEPDFSLLGGIASALGVTFERLLGTDESDCTYGGYFSPEDEGRALASARRAKGESQDDIAAAVGVSSDIVSKWERGIICPDIEQLCALSVHFDVPASKLYFGITQDVVTETPVQAVRRRRVSRVAIILAAFATVTAIVLAIVLPQVLTRRFTVTVDGLEYEVSSDDWFTPATPQKSGYDFEYFANSTGAIVNFPVKISSDESFTAVYSAHEYTIDYWLNGGSFATDAAYTFSMESGTVELATPVKNGATFEGWYLTPDYSDEAVENIECEAADINLYAKWSDEVYTIRYELCGGSLSESNPETVTAGQSVVLNEPIRKGYNFLGWYDSPDGGNLYESVGGENAENLTLYARWQESGSYFSITYHADGGTLLGENPQTVGAGEVHDLFGASKDFYDFIGWNTSEDGSGEWVERLYGVRGDTHLYAIYTPKVYTVVYDLDGGTYVDKVNPNRIAYGEKITLSPLLKAGHTFVGWFTAEDGGRQITEINADNIAELSTIYARFTPIRYTVELDAAGGEFVLGGNTYDYLDYEIYFGEELVLPECVLAGYDFIGWYDESGERVEVIDVENIGNIRLAAKYREAGLTYHIDYVLGGGILKEANPEEVAWGQVIGLNSPEREGWLFLGWNTADDGSGEYLQATPEGREEDLTLYAVWQEIMVSGSAENFEYKIGPESVMITGYTGPFGENVDLIIPSYIEDKPVVAVEGPLFDDTKLDGEYVALHSLVIPDTVTRLGERCFSRLDRVSETVTIPASVKQIGKECFRGSEFSLEFAAGSSLKSIGSYAFAGAILMNVPVLPEGLERLESYAFYDAYVVAGGIVLPDTLKYIGGYSLFVTGSSSNNHPCLYIPSSVEQIEANAFGESSSTFVRVYTALSKEQTAEFLPGWDSNAQITYIEKQVDGITLKDGDTQVYLEGQHFALPSPEKEGCTFIGWRDMQGNFVNNNFIPLDNGIVLEAVYELKTQSDGRSEYAPFLLENGATYELTIFGSQPFYIEPDVDIGARFRITFSIKGSNCPDSHSVALINYGNYLYSGVSYAYEGKGLYFCIDGTGGCMNDVLVITVRMEAV